MRRLVFAAAPTVAAMPAAWAQSGINPGTVISNVYESPECALVCGFGYSPPPYAYGAPLHRHRRGKAPPTVHD